MAFLFRLWYLFTLARTVFRFVRGKQARQARRRLAY
jgi:hypothetical protein